MDRLRESAQAHVVPSYKAPSDATWYHFLHGNVPGHQIDFMYRAEVPQGPLTRQHFSHLSRIMKYIEPQASAPYAFAIANLSRDDTQYEPGRGGLAMIFGHRVQGTRDHAGRQDPPFAHGIAAVSRELTSDSLLSVALSFYRGVLSDGPTYNCPSSLMYREYVRCLLEASHGVPEVLRTYLSGLSDLPQPPESSLSLRWLTNGARQPDHVVIVHPDGAPFSAVAACASRIAGVLYQSDVRWTSITSGREREVENGVTIRLVARRDASHYPSDDRVILLSDVPEDEAGIAKLLFDAVPLVLRRYSKAPVESWKRPPRREVGSSTSVEQTASSSPAAAEPISAPVQEAPSAPAEPEPSSAVYKDQDKAPGDSDGDVDLPTFQGSRRSRAWLRVSVVLGGAVALPFVYAAWGDLPFGEGTTLERPSSSSEPTHLVSRAETIDPAGSDPSSLPAASNAAGGPKAGAPRPPAGRARPPGWTQPKGSAAKTSSPSSSPPVTPPPPMSSTAVSAPSATGPSIIGAPPVFASAPDVKP
jgi:hypothetical protein